ncbi:MAG: queuosine precursor transporter [Desulfomicrobium sp.]|nr:queuosine precursor transporter [Pseudomonadota bacterium]MBV1713578.1 queuosine precursor transporter [Desulfomicrobium sp.]MBU4572114.1 queuosine precursor transporter [Pseudomonadota bacterium]MBU4594092.1 queuosine precursor transporter [Pseudomonadota bacterium]MBV1720957.1 queuosine precursor transporter [Desulfomicrobium sp.]
MNAIVILVASYIALQIFSDVGSLRIVMLGGMSIDAGTFIYPLTFTLRDMVHKTMGKQGARLMIITAAGFNLLMAGYFWVVSILPPDLGVGAQAEFGQVLAPLWRLVFASIVAEVISELTDTEIYSMWKKKVTSKHQWSRVLVSNAVSIPLDSFIFCWIAFGGLFEAAVVWSIFFSNTIIKFATTLVTLPAIYLVKEKDDTQATTSNC